MGNVTLNKQKLIQSAKGQIQKKILFFQSQSIFLPHFRSISDALLKSFPAIREVNLKRALPTKLLVTIKERKPFALWCHSFQGRQEQQQLKSKKNPQATTDNKTGDAKNQKYESKECYFIDEQGIIFKKIDNISAVSIIKITDNRTQVQFNNTNNQLGTKKIEPSLISKIRDIKQGLSKLGIEIHDIIIVSDVQLRVKTSKGWKIFFNLQTPLKPQIDDLTIVLQKEITPQDRQQLEYIDLRFDKIFYKLYNK